MLLYGILTNFTISKIAFFVKIKFIIENVLDKKQKNVYYKIEMCIFLLKIFLR